MLNKKIYQIVLISLILVSVAFLSLFFFNSEELNVPIDNSNNPLLIKNFNSQEEFSSFINNYKSNGQNNNYFYDRDLIVSDSLEQVYAEKSPSLNDYSQTNNQVQNVDEGDIIKTDGEYIYTINNNNLYIIKAYPGQNASILSTLELNGTISGLFIYEDKLAVFGTNYNNNVYREISSIEISDIPYFPTKTFTYLKIYDTSAKATPKLLKEFEFEGYYTNSRLYEGNIYLILSNSLLYQTDLMPPMIIDGEKSSRVPIEKIFYYDIIYRYPELKTIHSISLESNSLEDSKSIAVESNSNLYMSENNLYLTYTQYITQQDIVAQLTKELLESKLSENEKSLIKEIQDTKDSILSSFEKESKIMQIYYAHINSLTKDQFELFKTELQTRLKQELQRKKYLEFTVINKLNINSGQITPGPIGKVPGQIINQFSLDEKDDNLRIATTLSSTWNSFERETIDSTSNVYALNNNLEILGKLEGLAKGEQIYSARFVDNRLYMVTFRQVDPFFVIDLTNPENIKELGNLKIPGFSRYLHPYDNNTIIGIGQEADEFGSIKGLKISLFNVEDVQNPKEIAKFTTKDQYAYSQALYEHKAFLFSKQKDLLVIPAYSYYCPRENCNPKDNYNGALVFNITKDSIQLRGLIDHSQTNYYYAPSVQRSLYIEDLLYTKSSNLLRINDIQTLESVKNITLPFSSNIPTY